MSARAPAPLYFRIQPRLPIIVALAFGLYSMALLVYSFNASLRMTQNANAFLVAESVRRAETLADRAAEISREGEIHADLREISGYLINRDLGMSPRYGLDASLEAIVESFRQHASHRWSTSASRIVYLGIDGKPLADTDQSKPLPILSGPPGSAKPLHLDVENGLLVALEPVVFKDISEGFVVTATPVATLYRNLVASTDPRRHRELLLTTDGRLLPGGAGYPINADLLREFAKAPQNTVLPISGVTGSNIEAALGTGFLINTPVPGLALQLITVLPAERMRDPLASQGLLVALACVPILLLLGAIRLNRLSVATDKLQVEIAFAEQQRAWAEQRNIEMAEEIQRRELIERALKESEERWELAVRGANDGIWDWNPQSGEVHFSERWKSMLGYAPEEIRDEVQEWISRIHPDDLAWVMTEVDGHVHGKTEYYQCEHRLRCKDGSYRWILARGKALFDPSGETAVRVAGSHTDITDRVATAAKIKEHADQMNAIFTLSPDGFVSFDAEHRVKYASPAFFELTSLDEAEILGIHETEFAQRLGEICTAETAFADMRELQATPDIAAIHLSRRPGTRGKPIELTVPGKHVLDVSLRIATSENVSQILYLRDVSLETEVERIKSEFLSTAAHELRTPMASILGFSEVLLAQEFEEAERREFLDTIYRNAELMASIINELLDLARIEARRGKDFRIETLEAGPLLAGIVGGFKAPGQRAAPRLAQQEASLWLRGDRDKLTQAVDNLLSNAYKYSPAGGAVDIELLSERTTVTGQRVGLRVTDHGIGMSAEQQTHLFERFYRADTSGKIPGTGLGMSIVQEIVGFHGGEVSVTSAFGLGMTVTLWLPAANPSDSFSPTRPTRLAQSS
jgi:PAS domain S-box-containing protein